MSRKDRNSKRKNREFQGDNLKKRIKYGQEQTQFRSPVFKKDIEAIFFQPDFDDHVIDIIPYYAGNNDPTVEEDQETYTFEYLVHKQVGAQNTWVVCPSMYDKPCPICEYRNKLREDDDENYKKYFPRQRNLYNIICHDSKKEYKKGVQIWDVPYFWFEEHLMEISKKPARKGKEEKTVNFAHPSRKIGKSITFTIKKPKSEKDYPKYKGHAFDDRDESISQELIEQTHKLDELIELKSYKEIEKMFYGSDGKPKENNKNKKDNDNEENEFDFDYLLEELDDIDDNDELEEFIDDNNLDDLDIEIDSDLKFKKNLKSIKKELKKLKEKDEDNEDEDNEDDELTRDDIDDMNFRKLKKLIKEKGIADKVDIADYDKDDDEDMNDLRDDICDELGIDYDD